MSSHGDGKGYLIPDDPLPEDEICITVFVPNDDLYVAAFWGAYEYFTTWKAWERDTLKRGVICGERWKQSFGAAREKWLLEGGACVSEDEDMEIKVTCCCPDVPSDEVYPVPGGKADVGRGAADYFKRLLTLLATRVEAGVPKLDIIAEAQDLLPGASADDVSGLVDQFITDYPTPTAIIAEVDWGQINDSAGCSSTSEVNLSVFEASLATISGMVAAVGATFGKFLDLVSGADHDHQVEQIYIEAAWGDFSVYPLPDCTDVTTWSYLFDFGIDKEGWDIYLGYGTVESDGFKSEDTGSGQRLYIERAFSLTTVNVMLVTIVSPYDVVSGAFGVRVRGYKDGAKVIDISGADLVAGEHTYTYATNIELDYWLISPTFTMDDPFTLTRVFMSGSGSNPFA